MTTRALFAVRLSSLTDTSTSPERQLEHCANLTSARGWIHAGTADDLDVSATKFGPFDRPKLGNWLNNRADEFDAIVFWRFDRIARSSGDIAALIQWCRDNGKTLVSATEPFDTSDPFGEAMTVIIVALAQLEARTTSVRVQDMHNALKTTDRLASGVPPFGYRPTPHPSGKGVTYEPDPDMQEVIHTLAGYLLADWSLNGLARWMTDNQILSAWDRSRIRNDKEPKRSPWQPAHVKAILSSPATQGFKMTGSGKDRKHALTETGERIQIAAPTFDDETWEQIQEKLAERSESGKRRVRSSNPLLGIAKCGNCGATLSQNFGRSRSGKEYRYYRCGGGSVTRCTGVNIIAWKLDNVLESAFLLAEGDNYVREKVFVPGTDNREEIEGVRGSLDRLRRESDMGLITDETSYFNRLSHLTERLKELEKDPYRPSRWTDRETDQTYREAWQAADMEERRRLLRNADARVILHPGQRVELDITATTPHG